MKALFAHAILPFAAIMGLVLFVNTQPNTSSNPTSTRIAEAAPSQAVHRTWTVDEVKSVLVEIAESRAMALTEFTEQRGSIIFSAKTTTNGLLRVLDQMKIADLRPTSVAINPIKIGTDQLNAEVHINTKLARNAKLTDFGAGLRDITAAFPPDPDTVWATSLICDGERGMWEMLVNSPKSEFILDLRDRLQNGKHFSGVKISSAPERRSGDRTPGTFLARITMTSAQIPE